MPNVLEDLPVPTTPVVSPTNIVGSPLTTAGGVVAAIGGYLAANGAVMPHDTQSWISFVVGLLIAAGLALLKQPGK